MRLITGGSGFLGTALARLLVSNGLKARVFDMKRPAQLPAGVEFFQGDIRDAKSVSSACEGAARVYHLAALLPQSKAPVNIMRAVNVGGTRNVLDACAKHGVDAMVYLSSVEVYGRMGDTPCPEDAPKNPVGEYGRTKLECEALCLARAKEAGLHVAILRPPTLIGPGVTDKGVLTMMRGVRDGGAFPLVDGGRNRVQALDARDCAAAVLLIGDRSAAAGEAFNVRAAGDVPSVRELARALKKHARSRVTLIEIPAPLAIGALRFLDALGLSPIVPEHFEQMADNFISDTTKIENRLGWTPEKTYIESACDMYDWFAKGGGRS